MRFLHLFYAPVIPVCSLKFVFVIATKILNFHVQLWQYDLWMNISDNDSLVEIGWSSFMNCNLVLGAIFINIFCINSFCHIIFTLEFMIFDIYISCTNLYQLNCFNLNHIKILRFPDKACVVFFWILCLFLLHNLWWMFFSRKYCISWDIYNHRSDSIFRNRNDFEIDSLGNMEIGENRVLVVGSSEPVVGRDWYRLPRKRNDVIIKIINWP